MNRKRDLVDWITLFSIVVFPAIGGVYVYTNNNSERFVKKEIYSVQSKVIEDDLSELKGLIREGQQKIENKIDDISDDMQQIKTDQARIETRQVEFNKSLDKLSKKRR